MFTVHALTRYEKFLKREVNTNILNSKKEKRGRRPDLFFPNYSQSARKWGGGALLKKRKNCYPLVVQYGANNNRGGSELQRENGMFRFPEPYALINW